MSMEGLRRGAQSIGSGGNKGATRSSFYARWRPSAMNETLKKFLAAPPSEESITQVSEPIVLIPGQYPDMYARTPDGAPIVPPPLSEAHRFRSHTFPVFIQPNKPGQQGFKSFRDVVCSAGHNPHAPEPCVGCYLVDHGAKDSKPRDKWAFNIAHLGWYHTHPLVKDGQIQYKKGTTDPVMVKDECFSYKPYNIIAGRAAQARAQGIKPPRQCESCTQQYQFAFGDHRVLEVGWKYLKSILELDETLGKKCVNCGTHVIRVAFDCEHCGNELLNVAQTGWTNEQLDQYSKTPQQCRCGYIGLPKSAYECGFDERWQKIAGTGCPDNVEPRKMSVFDCVLWVQREGEKTESEIVVTKVELIPQFQMPPQLPDGRSLSLPDYLKELVKAPFNLPEMYSPSTLDEQSETLRVQNPYAQQGQQYAPYGQQGAPGAPGYPPQGYAPQPGYPPGPGGPPQGYAPQGQPPAQPGQPLYPNMPVPGRPNFGK